MTTHHVNLSTRAQSIALRVVTLLQRMFVAIAVGAAGAIVVLCCRAEQRPEPVVHPLTPHELRFTV